MAAKTGTKTADTLGQRMARLRRERGLTQVELAERLSVTQPAISDYENDDTRLARRHGGCRSPASWGSAPMSCWA